MSKVKTYTITLVEGDGTFKVNRVNDGFNFYELLGILEHTQRDIIDCAKNGIKPDEIERQVVKQKTPKKPKL